MSSFEHGHAREAQAREAGAQGATAPGRRTLAEVLPGRAAIQRMVDRSAGPVGAGGGGAGRGDLHESALAALAGSAGPLPYGDRIQAAFGRHDIGGIRAHTDGAAAEGTRSMGAAAFAMGDRVAFGGAPDLHTAAHEAAHVVQQRAGVHLKGGAGEEGDVYEQHADAVADAVVGGRSAEALLDQHAGPAGHAAPAQLSGGAAVLQAKWLQHPGTPFVRWDVLLNGLRWYTDPQTGQAFFQIEGDPGVDEGRLAKLESLEGPAKARSVEAWCTTTTLFEPSPRREPAPVEESDQGLGPTTVRGVPIPRVGFGTDIELTEREQQQLGTEDPRVLDQARDKKAYGILSDAIGTGSRLFDTAFEYGTLGALGHALQQSGVPPEDTFIVYKIKPLEVKQHFNGDLARAVIAACNQLGRQYLDVLMLHDMIGPAELLTDLAEQMKILVKHRIVRYLGLSNVATGGQIDAVANVGDQSIGVSFVQNKMHPHRQDRAMREECDRRDITYMGYSIMGSGNSTGKCGHVVSSETPYDVRQDGELNGIAREEHLPGGGELALAWGVQEGTVQIPKTSDPRRMIGNRRAGRHELREETMERIERMDDVITDDDQGELLEHLDVPKNQLRLILEQKSKWHALDRLYQAGLTDALNAIGAAVAADDDAKTAFLELMKYVCNFIDAGFCKSEPFRQELGRIIEPGDYSLIVAGLGTGAAVTKLKEWWAAAEGAGGCPRARTRVMGYLAIGLPANSDAEGGDDGDGGGDGGGDGDAPQQEVAMASSEERTVAIQFSDLELFSGEAVTDLTAGADLYYAKYDGKQIEFIVVANPGTGSLTITIKRTMG